jgi:hypothetical protein
VYPKAGAAADIHPVAVYQPKNYTSCNAYNGYFPYRKKNFVVAKEAFFADNTVCVLNIRNLLIFQTYYNTYKYNKQSVEYGVGYSLPYAFRVKKYLLQKRENQKKKYP